MRDENTFDRLELSAGSRDDISANFSGERKT